MEVYLSNKRYRIIFCVLVMWYIYMNGMQMLLDNQYSIVHIIFLILFSILLPKKVMASRTMEQIEDGQNRNKRIQVVKAYIGIILISLLQAVANKIPLLTIDLSDFQKMIYNSSVLLIVAIFVFAIIARVHQYMYIFTLVTIPQLI